MLDSTDKEISIQRSATHKSAVTQDAKDGSMVHNPTEKTLHENVPVPSNSDDEVSNFDKKQRKGDSA